MAAAVTAMVAACGQGAGFGVDLGGDAAADTGQASALVGATAGAMASRHQGLPTFGHAPRGGFASVPDRGDLVAYPQERVVRRAGPYAWHRADVSEAHALQAIVDGVLTLTAPSGERLRFQYDRHVEHDSGDWTWIGHVLGGGLAQDAILTFGAEAVFGSIAQPGGAPLNLTVRDGVSWLVETDTDARAAQTDASGRYDRPDFLLPPEIPVVEGLRAQVSMALATATATTATTTIDVLVGYTDGFAATWTTSLGDRSPIATRLNFMVDVTNESYVNSLVDAKVRMVHSMQVSYTDSSDNSDALVALTGSDGSATPTLAAVDPALQPLHSARDQYGADLVSLVRQFQHPEAVSCGVAWLLGGGQTMLHEGYEVYGMSVVSDGSDGGYYCEDTTFAHELGHNMGLAHDVETAKGDDGVLDADDYGSHAYSFGYRTGPSQGDFYTVMAYGDEQVNGYRVFSNPDITICGGFACGVKDQADNARTLRETQGIIASFRAAVVPEAPARADFNADGASDILWRNVSDGRNAIWLSGDAATPRAVARVADTKWRVVGIGDFDGDGASDILWRHASDGRNAIWRSGDAAASSSIAQVPSQSWQVAGVGDFDGDGRSDILWRNMSDGRNQVWRSGDAGNAYSIAQVASQAWQVVGIGDFDADGESDIFWRSSSDGRNSVWRSGDAGQAYNIAQVVSQAWQVAAVGDFDGNGQSDVVWRNAEDGRNQVWYAADSANVQVIASVHSSDWVIEAAADYDGDGYSDLLWRNHADGRNAIWPGGDARNAWAITSVASRAWQIVP